VARHVDVARWSDREGERLIVTAAAERGRLEHRVDHDRYGRIVAAYAKPIFVAGDRVLRRQHPPRARNLLIGDRRRQPNVADARVEQQSAVGGGGE